MPEPMSLDTLSHTLNDLKHDLEHIGVGEGTKYHAALEEASRVLYPAPVDAIVPGAPVFLVEAIAKAEEEAEILGNEWHSRYHHGMAEAIRTVNRALVERLKKETADHAE